MNELYGFVRSVRLCICAVGRGREGGLLVFFPLYFLYYRCEGDSKCLLIFLFFLAGEFGNDNGNGNGNGMWDLGLDGLN